VSATDRELLLPWDDAELTSNCHHHDNPNPRSIPNPLVYREEKADAEESASHRGYSLRRLIGIERLYRHGARLVENRRDREEKIPGNGGSSEGEEVLLMMSKQQLTTHGGWTGQGGSGTPCPIYIPHALSRLEAQQPADLDAQIRTRTYGARRCDARGA
jgi:hypothetical protein